jgi:hypothetical protein
LDSYSDRILGTVVTDAAPLAYADSFAITIPSDDFLARYGNGVADWTTSDNFMGFDLLRLKQPGGIRSRGSALFSACSKRQEREELRVPVFTGSFGIVRDGIFQPALAASQRICGKGYQTLEFPRFVMSASKPLQPLSHLKELVKVAKLHCQQGLKLSRLICALH